MAKPEQIDRFEQSPGVKRHCKREARRLRRRSFQNALERQASERLGERMCDLTKGWTL